MDEPLKNQNHSIPPDGLGYCPHLGLQEDGSTCLAYPSKWNYCHQANPIAPPKLEYQRLTCLNAAHKECDLYLSPSGSKMPQDLRYQRKKTPKVFSYAIKILGVGALIGVLVFSFIYRAQIATEISQLLMPPWQKTQMVTTPITATQTRTTSQTITMTPTESATNTPSPTVTQTRPAPVLQLETPIGGEVKFVIHRVLPGETLELYTREYNTTVEAIRASNVSLSQVLWVDRLIVIPVDNENVTGQTAFQPYQVRVDEISLEELAGNLQVDVESLRFYNNLWPGFTLVKGDWLLVPFEDLQP